MTDSIDHDEVERIANLVADMYEPPSDLGRLARAYLDLAARNERLREALLHIQEYWNGSRTDGAMSDALDFIVERARQAYEEGGR